MTHLPGPTGHPGNARHHPTVRRGTRVLRSQWISLAVILIVLGVAVLVQGMTSLPALAALACFTGAALSVWVGERMIRDLRHEYRYQDHPEHRER
jgi:membrane protein DedA with SNARE-associated domain